MQKQLDIRVCLGRGRTGKSTLIRHQLVAFKRVIIFDPNEEKENAKGAKVITGKAELVEAVNCTTTPFRVCWRGFQTMGKAAFEWGNEVAIAAENCAVYWAECDRYVSAQGNMADRWPVADQMVNAGRHQNLHLFACARRCSRVPRDLTANATRIMMFKTTEPSDLKEIKFRMGEEAARAVRRLEPFHAYEWTPDAEIGVKKSPFS